MAFPSTACILQHKLGLGKVACFDLEVCSFRDFYSLDVADGMLASGRYKCALVIRGRKDVIDIGLGRSHNMRLIW